MRIIPKEIDIKNITLDQAVRLYVYNKTKINLDNERAINFSKRKFVTENIFVEEYNAIVEKAKELGITETYDGAWIG